MLIGFIEIKNFRRLQAVRIDFSANTTLLVGANNSGKTSAMTALRYFLVPQNDFSIFDFPIALWSRINDMGDLFEITDTEQIHCKWRELLLPSLDVWLKVTEDEIHYIAHLIPTLDWSPDNGIGVRLRLEPKNTDELIQAYLISKGAACETLKAEESTPDDPVAKEKIEDIVGNGVCGKFNLWPENLMDFLKKRMSRYFTVKAYLLDPSKKMDPVAGVANIQELPDDLEPLEENPFKDLIKINEVPAHRGLSDYSGSHDDGDESYQDGRKQLLTAQLRTYYGKHLDPVKSPDHSDISALKAIHNAQNVFDARLKDCFKEPLKELEELGYPGIANSRLIISTSLKPMEGLNHQTAVQYDIAPTNEERISPYRLPEQCNGLGYQNLISMVFRLISYRDDWMKVGKAAQTDEIKGVSLSSPPPLHLVLLEEPEAHLHVQVQQVFIRKAYDVLRNHDDLKDNKTLSTQLVVSTHSSHIAHEVDFAQMRYFRRHPARNSNETPTSTVVNLSEVFGKHDETAKFVSRYLRATHADLFFADGAILVEGTAERMLVPHFIREHYEKLNRCYITLLEVGGSHAHHLAPLLEHLGLNTLIITDIDSVEDTGHHPKTRPQKGRGLLTGNNVLKDWFPQKKTIDELLDIKEGGKEKAYGNFSIRVAYQTPLRVTLNGKSDSTEAIPRTFEDALAFENIDFFRNVSGNGLFKKFKDAIDGNKEVTELHEAFLKALENGNKAEFALNLLYFNEPASIRVPEYIHNGLEWLQNVVLKRQQEVLPTQSKDMEDPEKDAK
ncbi:MAG: AAA family ATPase [Nitrospirota bacterium]